MRYLCTSCSYIYDESIGDQVEDIKAGTKFFDLGNNFKCPVCGDDSDLFQEIIEEVNYIDENDILGLENEHFINIENKENGKISVFIGRGELHPTGEEHRVTHIFLLDEYGDFIDEEFISEGQDPIVEFDISDLDDYEIRVRCRLHGLWGRKIEE